MPLTITKAVANSNSLAVSIDLILDLIDSRITTTSVLGSFSVTYSLDYDTVRYKSKIVSELTSNGFSVTDNGLYDIVIAWDWLNILKIVEIFLDKLHCFVV